MQIISPRGWRRNQYISEVHTLSNIGFPHGHERRTEYLLLTHLRPVLGSQVSSFIISPFVPNQEDFVVFIVGHASGCYVTAHIKNWVSDYCNVG